jgi:large subunit ribosomal protein L24
MQKLIKNDEVKVMTGKDKGKTGVIEKILKERGMALIMGVNLYKRHIRKMGEIEGGIIDLPKPLKLSNIQLVCPNCNKTTRVGIENGKDGKIRICKKCKQSLPSGNAERKKDVSIKKTETKKKGKS